MKEKEGHEKIVFKEGNFKEFEKVGKDGQPEGEMKEEFEKSGWMNQDDDELDVHVKSHAHDKPPKSDKEDAEWDKQEASKWQDFISSTKKIASSIKDDASEWYNGDKSKSKEESTEAETS